MSKIGILFDIDELGGGLYGYEAYKILFAAIYDTRLLAGSILSDGDTNATLRGQSNQYCIAVDTINPLTLNNVRFALERFEAKGLLPPASRFLEDGPVSEEPLAESAYVGANGELLNCDTGWVIAAWKESQVKLA